MFFTVSWFGVTHRRLSEVGILSIWQKEELEIPSTERSKGHLPGSTSRRACMCKISDR